MNDAEVIRQEIIEELQGYERTIENLQETILQGIIQLLQMKMPIAQIAKIFNVSEEFVESVKSKK